MSSDLWELRVDRLTMQSDAGRTRTYGAYGVFINGEQVGDQEGFVCESAGPGDNGDTGVQGHRRIEPGKYGISTHFGGYVTIGYSMDSQFPGRPPMPAFQLLDTGDRTNILVHPGHPPHLYLSSIGCLNLTSALNEEDLMDFWDSRSRVLAAIQSLKAFSPSSFSVDKNTIIPNAFAIISGEPN